MATKAENQKLSKRIDKVEALLKRAVEFAIEMCRRYGTTTEHEKHRYHTHTKSAFKCGDFHFTANHGITEMGGNIVDILFKGERVLHVYWQDDFDPKECEIRSLDHGKTWSNALGRLVRSPKLVEKLIKQEAEKEAKKSEEPPSARRQRETDLYAEWLTKRARTLGLIK